MEKNNQIGNNNIHVSGERNCNVGNRNETNNYNGLSFEDLISMMEERFQHMLKKEEDIRAIFDENRKLTDEMCRQNEEFRKKNDDYRAAIQHINALTDRINHLTDKLLENK